MFAEVPEQIDVGPVGLISDGIVPTVTVAVPDIEPTAQLLTSVTITFELLYIVVEVGETLYANGPEPLCTAPLIL